MLVFSLSSPIGIAIGTIICHFSADSNGMDIAVAVLESISTGTFLFVVFIGPFLTFVSFVCANLVLKSAISLWIHVRYMMYLTFETSKRTIAG